MDFALQILQRSFTARNFRPQVLFLLFEPEEFLTAFEFCLRWMESGWSGIVSGLVNGFKETYVLLATF